MKPPYAGPEGDHRCRLKSPARGHPVFQSLPHLLTSLLTSQKSYHAIHFHHDRRRSHGATLRYRYHWSVTNSVAGPSKVFR